MINRLYYVILVIAFSINLWPKLSSLIMGSQVDTAGDNQNVHVIFSKYAAKGKMDYHAKCIVKFCFIGGRYVRKRIDHWCSVEPKNPNPQVHSSSGKLGNPHFLPLEWWTRGLGISLSTLNTNIGFSLSHTRHNWASSWESLIYAYATAMTLSFRTDRSRQIVQTQIRLLLEEQSDQGLDCLLFPLHHFNKITKG